MSYEESIRLNEIRANTLAQQAITCPDGPIARTLNHYQTAANANLPLSLKGFRADLTAGITSTIFFLQHGIHPAEVIRVRQSISTTSPGRA